MLSVGVVHTTTEDDVYEGYFIPKGMGDRLEHFNQPR